jgi:predicted nucleic acid-binding protein
MSAPEFLDTNILVYAYDSRSPNKQQVAQAMLRRALTGPFVISTQVLSELATVLLHKISPPAKPEVVTDVLDALGPIKVIVPDADMVRRAVEARASYGVHLYDGMIISAAERGGCSRIWSEDLNPGQKYFGIPVENPFR